MYSLLSVSMYAFSSVVVCKFQYVIFQTLSVCTIWCYIWSLWLESEMQHCQQCFHQWLQMIGAWFYLGVITILIWPLRTLSQPSHGIGTSDGNGKSYKTSTGAWQRFSKAGPHDVHWATFGFACLGGGLLTFVQFGDIVLMQNFSWIICAFSQEYCF